MAMNDVQEVVTYGHFTLDIRHGAVTSETAITEYQAHHEMLKVGLW
jgi:hypothetical protein